MLNAAGLLAVDVDGTLITDHGKITEKVYTALEKIVSMHWEVIIASGRTFFAAKPIMDKLPFLRYAVLSNGACIIDARDHTVVHMEKLAPSLVKDVINIVYEQGAIPALYDTKVENQKIYYDTLVGACEFFKWYVKEDPRCELVEDVAKYTGDILQIGMIAEKEVIFSVKKALSGIEATVMTLPFESVHIGGKSSGYWFIQVVGKNAKKNLALNRMARLLNIPAGRLVAVGDNYNDCDMIESADIGVAMGNAPEEVKRLAHVVVSSNNHSGLAQVVDEVILSGKYFS